MYGLDMINTSVLGALGCDMNTFLRYFPAAETMYNLHSYMPNTATAQALKKKNKQLTSVHASYRTNGANQQPVA